MKVYMVDAKGALGTVLKEDDELRESVQRILSNVCIPVPIAKRLIKRKGMLVISVERPKHVSVPISYRHIGSKEIILTEMRLKTPYKLELVGDYGRIVEYVVLDKGMEYTEEFKKNFIVFDEYVDDTGEAHV